MPCLPLLVTLESRPCSGSYSLSCLRASVFWIRRCCPSSRCVLFPPPSPGMKANEEAAERVQGCKEGKPWLTRKALRGWGKNSFVCRVLSVFSVLNLLRVPLAHGPLHRSSLQCLCKQRASSPLGRTALCPVTNTQSLDGRIKTHSPTKLGVHRSIPIGQQRQWRPRESKAMFSQGP